VILKELTLEYLDKFNLKILQPTEGYRYSIDSFLLADFVSNLNFKKAVEFGGGCGIISFLLSSIKSQIEKLEIFEIQQSLFKCLELNKKNNKFKNTKIIVRNEDLKYAIPSFVPEVIFSNPPFRNPNNGKVSPLLEKAVARHEFSLNLSQLFNSFSKIAGKGTKFALIHLYERRSEIEKEAKSKLLFPEKIVRVRAFRNSLPRHIIYLFSKSLKPIIMKDIYIYTEDGKYNPNAWSIDF